MFELRALELSKRFGSRKVLSEVCFNLACGQSLAVVGPNGSGKSTLLKILVSLLRPTRGKVEYRRRGRLMDEGEMRAHTSFVAPYLTLYDHLSGEENLKFFAAVAGDFPTGKEFNYLLARVGLEGRGMDYVAGYSSGMKQRLKYAVALVKRPAFLFLDEPTAALDDIGKETVSGILEECRRQSIVIIATNEKEEYQLAEQLCRLGQ